MTAAAVIAVPGAPRRSGRYPARGLAKTFDLALRRPPVEPTPQASELGPGGGLDREKPLTIRANVVRV